MYFSFFCPYNLQSALEKRGITPLSSEVIWKPQIMVELPEGQAEDVLKLIARLEGDDDVQKVFHNLT